MHLFIVHCSTAHLLISYSPFHANQDKNLHESPRVKHKKSAWKSKSKTQKICMKVQE